MNPRIWNPSEFVPIEKGFASKSLMGLPRQTRGRRGLITFRQ